MPHRVLVLGATSLVGSHFVAASTEALHVEAVGRVDPRTLGLRVKEFHKLDLSDRSAVEAFLDRRREDRAWINFVARTDVDGCEKERPENPPGPPPASPGSAWTMNAELPGWIAEASHRHGIPLIHLSTDFVFDGADGPYPDKALPSPWGPWVSWYGYTKGVGEERVRAADPGAALLRVSYPYRAVFHPKTDFARNLLDRARAGQLYPLYTDQRFTPTWIPDITRVLRKLVETPLPGTLHVAAPEPTTPWEFGTELLQAFHVDGPPPATARMADALGAEGRAPRPLKGGLRTDRLLALGITPTGYREGIRAMVAELATTASGA